MFKWIDKQDDIDFVLAKDINDIAHSVIELEKTAVKVVDQTYSPESTNAQSGKAVAEALKTVNVDLSNYYTKDETDNKLGDIEIALDNIIAIQNTLIGGGNV